MSVQFKAIILAAGRGTRMRSLTAQTPKPLLEVAGKPLVIHQLERLARAGVSDVVINIARRGGQIRSVVGDGSGWGLRVEYSDEGDSPLETAGGIRRALPLIGSDAFFVVNADVMTDFDLAALGSSREPEGVLLLVPNPAHHPDGDFGIDEQGVLQAAGGKLTYGGMALLTPGLFADCGPGEQPLRPILDAAVARGGLRGCRYPGRWLDVGTPERLEQARRLFMTRDLIWPQGDPSC